jgi:hypothetical protein
MQLQNALSTRTPAALAAALVLAALAACGGENAGGAGDKATADQAPVCTTPVDSIIGNALDRFIVTRDPQPMRFLLPLGTPEAVPDGAQFSLNTLQRRPFLWPPDAAQQKEAINIARSRGTFVTIALFYHGTQDMPDGRKMVEFSGRYVDRINDGKQIPRTAIYFDCQAPEGRKYRAADEPPDTTAAPAPPGDTSKAHDSGH